MIDALWKAIEDPNMPAEEAMVLYLVLYHAFYLKELETVRIPSQCRPMALGVESLESLEDVLSLEWLPRELSRADSFWVALERFFRWSRQTSRGYETWLGDSYENEIRNYEIQRTHTYSLAPGGAPAADP